MVIKSVVKFISLLSLFVVAITNSAIASTLTVTPDRNPVMEREPFLLEISADDSVSANDLDLSPLRQSGFTIGRTSTNSSTQIINGSISKTTNWSVMLVANRAGKYQIPALEVDGIKSKPLTIEVVKVDHSKVASNQLVFVKNQLETNEVYVQQSTKMVTRLYISPEVKLQSGALSEPILQGATIQQIGQDEDKKEIVMGKRYRVIKRIYSITPQASGEFTLQSPAFNGEVKSNRSRNSFFSMGQSKPISAFDKDQTIKVLPIPANYQGPWLASNLVQLHEEIQPNKLEYEVGEAITRTFSLTALNVSEEQLPEVAGSYPAEFKVYPDQSEAVSAVRDNAIIAQRVSSEAIVINQPGTYVLPQVSVPWFNVKTRKQEFAIAPEQTIKVIASTSPAETPVVVAPNEALISEPAECETPIAVDGSESTPPVEKSSSWFDYLGWILWVLTSIAFAVAQFFKKKSEQPKVEFSQPASPSFNSSTLKKACQSNNAAKAREQLLLWAKDKFGDKADWSLLKAKTSPEFNAQLELLESNQYSANRQTWIGNGLWLVFQQENKKFGKNTKTNDADLPPLN